MWNNKDHVFIALLISENLMNEWENLLNSEDFMDRKIEYTSPLVVNLTEPKQV